MGAKNIKKSKKNFWPILPLRVTPWGYHNSAQGWNLEKRLDDVAKIGITNIHTKFHGYRPSSFV